MGIGSIKTSGFFSLLIISSYEKVYTACYVGGVEFVLM
jgi:hypothetical protein